MSRAFEKKIKIIGEQKNYKVSRYNTVKQYDKS